MKRVKVEKINKMTQWIRDIKIGQCKIGYLPTERFKSINSTISRMNAKFKKDGEDKWIVHWTNTTQNRIALLAMTTAERAAIKQDTIRKNNYEKEIPENFFNRDEPWSVGSWHR